MPPQPAEDDLDLDREIEVAFDTDKPMLGRSPAGDVEWCVVPRGLSLIALIEDPRIVRRILNHLQLPIEVLAPRPARSPPLVGGHMDPWYDDAADMS